MHSMHKTIIFGDIHACLEEWRELIEKIKPSKEDLLVSVGDLIGKGPFSRATLDFARKLPNLRIVTGNHELHFIRAWKKNNLETLTNEYQKLVVKELGPDFNKYMEWINTWPFYLDLPEAIVVHAGVRPKIRLEKQSKEDLCHLRNLENDKPWYEAYTGKKLIVYGHWARQGLSVKDKTIGLDSGCVYGKQLSALILPERKIVQVQAKKIYQADDLK